MHADLQHAAIPDEPLRAATLRQDWRTLTFLHWPYPPRIVQQLLPAGLRVETYRGMAWVTLVPFRMTIHPLPWLRGIPETNVRTYVIGPGERPGVWFFSLDITSVDAMLAGRAWGLPYFWSRMSVHESGDEVTYRCARRSGRRPTSEISIRIGGNIEAGDFENYLTARFALWSRPLHRLIRTRVDHPQWPLAHADITRLDDSLITAAGLPAATHDPIAQFSPGVAARIGFPSR